MMRVESREATMEEAWEAPSASAAVGGVRSAADANSPTEGAGPDKDARSSSGSHLADAEALRLLEGRDSGVRPELSRRGYRFAKRAFDIAASGAAVALLLVPGAILCAVICAKSPGAGPLYSQWRIGRVRRDGSYRPFRMWKFRSMAPDADARLEELRALNEADGPLFKIKDDPRVIPGVGAFIRRHSIGYRQESCALFRQPHKPAVRCGYPSSRVTSR